MIGRRPRSLSQRNYQLVQEIKRNAERFRQLDAGLTYQRPATDRRGERPLHIGPQIEAMPVRDGDWAA